MTDASLTATGTIDAPVERVFALLADPDRHPDFDTSGMVQRSETHLAVTELGDVFVMAMHNEIFGDYTIHNRVIAYEPDREIGWAPGGPDDPGVGHTYLWRLEPDGDDRTVATVTYDWSAVTDQEVLPYFPVVSADQLAESIGRVEELLA